MDKEDAVYTHTHTHTHIPKMEYYSAIKRNNNAICSNTDGSRNYNTKWSNSEKNKYHITYMWNLKKISLFTQQKPTQKISKSNYGYERGNMRGRIN